jgi:hypothetical protein
MAIDVHVIFSGIVSLIPYGDGTFLVRLQDGSGWGHPHFPNLVAPIDLVTATPAPNKTVTLTDTAKTVMAAWRISNGTISIDSTIQDSTFQQDLRATLKIVDGAPGCGEAKRPKRDVEVDVRKGSLMTTALTPEAWFYDHKTAADAAVLDHEICWSFKIAAAPLKMTFPGIGPISLRQLGTNPIELRLQNTPPGDYFPQLPKPQATDDHIRHYFEQCTCPRPPMNRYLKVYLGAVSMPGLPKHTTHALDGFKLALLYPRRWSPLQAFRAWQQRRLLAAELAATGHPGTLQPANPRLNCPPAVWESLEP